MHAFWINFIVFTTIYVLLSIALFTHSHYQYVISRSPTILQITLWSNYLELILTFLLIYSQDLGFPSTDPAAYWIIDAGLIAGHSLLVFCYIIRAYRLFIVFNVDFSTEKNHKWQGILNNLSTQRWMIITLIGLISPIILVLAVIYLTLVVTGDTLGLYNHGDYGQRTAAHFMIYSFYDFLLQLSLIITMYYIRIVQNEFQMLKEMISVTVILNVASLFSLIVYANKKFLFINIARNVLLLVISIVAPIVVSHVKRDRFELVTMDMLGSIDLIMQHPATLNAFEEFLKTYDYGDGVVYLELFLCCECYFSMQNKKYLKDIKEKMEMNSIEVPRFNVDSLGEVNEIDLHPLHSYCLDILELDYYPPFKNSKQYQKLCSYVHRKEVFSNRLSQTSFLPCVVEQKRGMGLISFYEN